ncbi:SNA2 integral membrane [Fusarium mundagurra]|uniref:SNA2 integral membrane n=1 Tax=Fusarium mundagurra TaxID=1567541 RepID=A0A8H6DBI4_9HYPO|nr:SNA2 integral membrane [Fusarium mundagurra]
MCSADLFLAFLAILFPPLPVWVKCGLCSADSLINILLLCLAYIPGLIHAWYIIAKYPEPPYEYESLPQHEGNRVTYVYVQCPPGPHQHSHGHPQNQQPKPQPQPHHGGTSNNNNSMNYGTQNAGGSSRPAPQQHGVTSNCEGSSESQGVPPSYADVVAGDHKIQSKD